MGSTKHYLTEDSKVELVDTVKTNNAVKYDQGKPDLSLVPAPAMEAMARALAYGETKYGRYNYCKGFTDTRMLSACLRHIFQYLNGENKDKESGLCHLEHAIANLAMLLHCRDLNTLTDNRQKTHNEG